MGECITMEYRPPFTVKITYFKKSGKYYTDGEYTTQMLQMYEIWEELQQMFDNGKRPGLVDGVLEFYAVVEVPNHPHNHPHLIRPNE
jgi:hypothetical protein